MPDAAAKLRAALDAEALDLSKREAEFRQLVRMMEAYQQGTGPAPTHEQFAKWREGVETAVRTRALKSGFGALS